MKKLIPIVSMIIVLTVVVGCGYRFSPGGEHISSTIQKVYIENIANTTSEAFVENFLKNAFVNQFRRDKRFTIAGTRDGSDAILSGSITGIGTSHVSYRSNDIAREDRVSMNITVRFQEHDGKVIWENKNLSGREAYTVSTDPNRTDKNRRTALRKLSVDLAEKAYRSIMSGF